jgi:hypothetical protein
VRDRDDGQATCRVSGIFGRGRDDDRELSRELSRELVSGIGGILPSGRRIGEF